MATTPVKKRIKTAAEVHSSALASAGYQLMRLIKEGIKSRAPGDVVWPALHLWSARRTLGGQKLRSYRRRAQAPAQAAEFVSRHLGTWPVLTRAVKYRRESAGSITLVRTGFLGGQAARFAAQIAQGQTIAVTPRMRRKFFAKGLPLAATVLRFPPREHVGAVYRRYHARVLGFVQARVNAAYAGQDPQAVKSMF